MSYRDFIKRRPYAGLAIPVAAFVAAFAGLSPFIPWPYAGLVGLALAAVIANLEF